MFKIFSPKVKVFKEEDVHNIEWLISLILLLNLYDVVTTQIGIYSLGAKEVIPTMKYMMDIFGPFWWWIKVAVVSIVCYEFYHTKNKTQIMLVLSLFISVVLSNFYTIGKYIIGV